MSRWSPMDLAEITARNPALRVNQAGKPEFPRIPAPDKSQGALGGKNDPSTRLHSPKVDYKAMLVQQCELAGMRLEPEFRFHPERKFRADWKVNGHMVLVEYEGGLYSGGKRGHSSIAGIQRDIEKANLAQILGYIVIRVAPMHVVSGEALSWIEEAIKR